jgi:hypothetical protein
MPTFLRNILSEDGDSIFLRNVDIYLQVYTASKPRKTSSFSFLLLNFRYTFGPETSIELGIVQGLNYLNIGPISVQRRVKEKFQCSYNSVRTPAFGALDRDRFTH